MLRNTKAVKIAKNNLKAKAKKSRKGISLCGYNRTLDKGRSLSKEEIAAYEAARKD